MRAFSSNLTGDVTTMKKLILTTALLALPFTANAGFMDADWAKKACDGWNNNATLTNELGGDEWAANDGGRGYKLIQMYRDECGADSKVQINIRRSAPTAASRTARPSTTPWTTSCMQPTRTGPAWVKAASDAAPWAQ
jgi:hypothetical protein